MALWFRFYGSAMRNPKVAKLADNHFRLWVDLLSVAAENDGYIPPLEDLKHLLNRRLDHLSTGIKRLISVGLIDRLEDGYEPHNWTKFQYKSDTSTDRVKRHREKRNVSVTPPDTEPDTEPEKSKGGYAFDGLVVRLNSRDFKAWSKAYPDLDLAAELQSRDDWLRTQSSEAKKRWFNSTSNWLAKRQGEARKSREVDPMEGFIV